MFPKISSNDTDWNRRAGITNDSASGFLMDEKNGISYFAWIHGPEEVRFYKCESDVFNKHFARLDEIVEHEFDPFERISFVRYPLPTPSST